MNLFATIKAAVPVKQAAKHYGLKVNRNGIWMHWKSHPKRFGLLLMQFSAEHVKNRNTDSLPAGVDRTWKFNGGFAYD